MQVCTWGGGSWGTALAHLLACAGHTSTLLVREITIANGINQNHQNPHYMQGIQLHPALTATTDPTVLAKADLVLLALPCQTQRQNLLEYGNCIREDAFLVNASKGVELGSLKRMSEVVAESLCLAFGSQKTFDPAHYAVLSGPSFAKEVLEGKPTAVVLASISEEHGALLRAVFSSPDVPWFRTYSSTDVTGVELGGAVKNVIALAAGLCDALNFGANARAALLTRGLTEIRRLGVALGAQASTFMGLSGNGDLILTCTGDLSRNRQVGLRLGRGENLEEILSQSHSTAEGVKTAESVYFLAHKMGVEMPITSAVYAILHNTVTPREAVMALLSRSLKEEE